MKPADLRTATWREVLTHLTEDLVRVHLAWAAHGPGTTDLYQLGLVDLVGRRARSGVYAYVSRAEAEASAAWRTRLEAPEADEETPAPSPSSLFPSPERAERIGFVTVEEAIASLSPAERRALGARLMGESAHGRHRPESTATAQLDLLPA